jgi:hypothetical protein
MAGGDRRKCKCCLKLFRPDPRNRHHQRYRSVPACRAASKAASQARSLAVAENQGYFRGPVNVARVQAWRSHHPGYWRKRRRAGTALQDVSMAQPICHVVETANAARSPLQEVLTGQPDVLMGLIAHIVGTPLQDDIVRTTDRLLRLGQDILATSAALPADGSQVGRSLWVRRIGGIAGSLMTAAPAASANSSGGCRPDRKAAPPTLEQIAAERGVSPATVSRVLRRLWLE